MFVCVLSQYGVKLLENPDQVSSLSRLLNKHWLNNVSEPECVYVCWFTFTFTSTSD